jgi:SNF2 family DNA or RNA helicase
MIITFWKGIFVCDVLDERGALKKAGFELHEPTLCNLKAEKCKACRAEIGRRFWSDKIESATRLRTYCNPRALQVMKEHLERLGRSRAVDADLQIPAPPGLHYIGYQKAGIAYALQRQHTLIADEPGLGKTIQALGFINQTKPRNVLCIAPTTLRFNWRNEALKWLTQPMEIWPVEDKNDVIPPRDGLFVITNYEKLVGDSPLLKSLQRQWDVAVFDECHMLKNPESKRSQAILGHEGLLRRTKRALFLSGTPAENYPKEIWAIAAAICPAKFGNRVAFEDRYCGRHKELHGDTEVWVNTGSAHLSELQQRLRSSLMVRRLKSDVLKELPPKRRQLVELDETAADWKRHPQFKKWQEIFVQRYEEAMARVETAKTDLEYQEAVLTLEKIEIGFTEMSEFRHQSALVKLPLCLKYLDELLTSGVENVVLFAHHSDVIAKLAKHFEGRSVVVSGATPQKGPNSREAAVKAFQEKRVPIFIGQIRAAGIGLTLTAANTVVFVEIDWVPTVLTQAEDRLCRIGQKKMVHVIHLVLANTLDANMCKKIVAKQAVLEKMLDRQPDLKLRKRSA